MDNASDYRSEDTKNYSFDTVCQLHFSKKKKIPSALHLFYIEASLEAVSPDSCRMRARPKPSSLSPPAQLLNGKSSSRQRCFQWDAPPPPLISSLESLRTGKAHTCEHQCADRQSWHSRQAPADAVALPADGHDLTCPVPQQPTRSLSYTLLPSPHPSFTFHPGLPCPPAVSTLVPPDPSCQPVGAATHKASTGKKGQTRWQNLTEDHMVLEQPNTFLWLSLAASPPSTKGHTPSCPQTGAPSPLR